MKRLVRDTKRKVLLILDNLRVHHAKKVKVWLAKHRDEIEVFFLPPYSPEHNPDEYLNSSLKRDIGSKPMPASESDLSNNARSSLTLPRLVPGRQMGQAQVRCHEPQEAGHVEGSLSFASCTFSPVHT